MRLLPAAEVALDREGIGYTEVNIEDDPASADYVMSVNGGNQTVPTVVFPDGSAATNPSLARGQDPPRLSPGGRPTDGARG